MNGSRDRLVGWLLVVAGLLLVLRANAQDYSGAGGPTILGGFSRTQSYEVVDTAGNVDAGESRSGDYSTGDASFSSFVDAVNLPPGPPLILAHPDSFTSTVGGSANFVASAVSALPLQFVWLLNGDPQPGLTTPTLDLSNLEVDQEGAYQLRITGPGGTKLTDPAMLRLLVRSRLLSISSGPEEVRFLVVDEDGRELGVERGNGFRVESSTDLKTWQPVTPEEVSYVAEEGKLSYTIQSSESTGFHFFRVIDR